ncbi:hypothetical protein BHM03_00042289, partial [Ensete ventricosum]
RRRSRGERKEKKRKGLPAPSPFFPTYLPPAKHSHRRYPLPRPLLLPASAASCAAPSSPAPATGQRRLSRSLLPLAVAVLSHISRRHLCRRLVPPQPLPSSFPAATAARPLRGLPLLPHLPSAPLFLPFLPCHRPHLPPTAPLHWCTPVLQPHSRCHPCINRSRTHPVFFSPTAAVVAGLSLPSSFLLCQPQSSEPLLPCFSPSSLLLTCRRCHLSWAAACHSPCYRYFPAASSALLLPPTPPPSAHSSAASASYCRSASVPLSLLPQSPSVVPSSSSSLCSHLNRSHPSPDPSACRAPTSSFSSDHVARRNPLPLLVVSIFITIAPPLRRKLMPLTQQQKKELKHHRSTILHDDYS